MTAEIDKTARDARPRGPARVRIWRRIEWVDTDKSGYWHFGAAFRLFEAAETTLWQHLGGKEQLGDIPRVHVTASFRKKVVYLDVVTVDLVVERIGRSSVSFSITISRDGELCVEGEMVVAAVDPESNKSQPIPDDIRRALESVGELREYMPTGPPEP